MSALSEATKRAPFSSGMEGEAWQDKWCAYCEHDHGMSHHDGCGDGCDIWFSVLVGAGTPEFRWPEPWLPEPDDGTFSMPSRLVCLAFRPCHKDGCEGDPGMRARADRVAEVQVYWSERGR